MSSVDRVRELWTLTSEYAQNFPKMPEERQRRMRQLHSQFQGTDVRKIVLDAYDKAIGKIAFLEDEIKTLNAIRIAQLDLIQKFAREKLENES